MSHLSIQNMPVRNGKWCVPALRDAIKVMPVIAFSLCGSMAIAQNDAADPEPPTSPERWKLTTGLYQVAGDDLPAGSGLDINLRYGTGDNDAWLGWFRSPILKFSQLRGGWDHSFTLGPLRVLPSLQAASGGFFGSSVAVEGGHSWFVGAGFGRTNLRSYANLNFDPNDSWTAYGGYRWSEITSLQLQVIRDNRQNPDQ